MAKRRKRDSDEVPALGKAWFADATRIADGPAAMLEYVRAQRRRGPQKAPRKRVVTIRLSPEVVDAYKGTGRGWQSRIDADLKKTAKRLHAATSLRRD